MRTILGYDENRRPIWSENIPAENPQWGGHIGGRAIEERAFNRSSEPTTIKNLQQKIRRMRGENLK